MESGNDETLLLFRPLPRKCWKELAGAERALLFGKRESLLILHLARSGQFQRSKQIGNLVPERTLNAGLCDELLL